MKKIFTFILMTTLSTIINTPSYANNDDFLPADKAFILTTTESDNFYDFSWKIEKDYYLYQDKISIINNNTPLPLSLPQSIEKQDPTFGLVGVYYDNLNIKINKNKIIGNEIVAQWQGCSDKGLCYNPQSIKININNLIDIKNINNFSTSETSSLDNFKELLTTNYQSTFSSGKYDEIVFNNNKEKSLNHNVEVNHEKDILIEKNINKQSNDNDKFSFFNLDNTNNTYLIFLIAFVIGITLSFTPCVLPMIPIMSTIIVGDKKEKKLSLIIAFLIPMVIIYSLIGLAVSLIGASVQSFLQSTIVIGLISILFILLSFSMFGFYQIELPSYFKNKLNSIKIKNNTILSSMTLGSISAIISSPCVTAPLASVFLYIAQLGNPLLGFLILLTLSIGMSIPLILFGLFGQIALPKAGNWLNVIKNILGYAMLLLSVYMLDKINGTIAMIFLFIILISISISLYQMSKYHKGIKEHIALLLSIVIFSGNIFYVSTNLTTNTLSLSSRQEDSIYKKISTIDEIKNILSEQNDFRPIFYFTASWCATCQVIEKNVLTEEMTKKLNSKKTTLIKLDVSNPDPEMIELMKKINVFGPPTLVEFNEGLGVLKKHNGNFNQETLLSF